MLVSAADVSAKSCALLHDWQGDSDDGCCGVAEGKGGEEFLIFDNKLLLLEGGCSDEQLAPVFLLC